jgi:phosphonate transport system substrate-binding protein
LRNSRLRILACLFGLLAGSALFPAVAAAVPRVLVLGCVSNDPKSDYEQLKPLLDYVVPRMADVGISEGRILMARDMQQMGSYLRRGRVDWLTGSAATGMQLQMRGGARPLLLSERNGVSRDYTVFFVRRDSSIVSPEDLRGRSIAFRDASSTGAYFVPAMQLLRHGMALQRLLSPMDHPDPGSVGFVLGGSELNIATWVHRGLIDAGTVSHSDWNNPQRTPPLLRNDFRIIERSPDYPLALEMTRGDLDTAVRARLREVLLEASSDPGARDALLQFSGTTRFLPLEPEIDSVLQQVRAGIARVRAEAE